MSHLKPDHLSIAKEHWGEDLPDWVKCLAEECARTTQSRVAGKIGYSASVVNQVLKDKYKGNVASVEDVVRGVFMNAEINCPALGMLPTQTCRKWREAARNFSGHNAERVRMYRACTRCPRNNQEDDT